MSRLIFDIETDGLLDQLTKIHSLVIKDADDGTLHSCYAEGYKTIEDGLQILSKGDEIIGHNIMGFDIPAIQKIYPWFTPKGKVTDTLVISRLIWSDLKEKDFNQKRGIWNLPEAPNKLLGSHSLEAWGWRMGEWKGDYSKLREQEIRDQFNKVYAEAFDKANADYEDWCQEFGKKITKVGFQRWLDAYVDLPPAAPTKDEITAYVWGDWNQSMQIYCEQDVEVTHKFLQMIEKKAYSQEAIQLEHDFQRIILLMEGEGFTFNKKHAEDFQRRLMKRKVEIEEEVRAFFPPWEVRTKFLPKVTREDLGYVAGEAAYKTRTIIFNPGSRDHIADRLSTLYGWVPTEFTDKGKPKVDEDVMKDLPYPPCPLLTEYFLVTKRLGALCEGKQAWMNNVDPDGRIRQRVITNGAVTGRCTHRVVVNVPSVDAAYGEDSRECFGPPKGMKQVGADLSGLELRCLAHYMARWDGGAYGKELLEGDIHTTNQMAAGLPTRGNAKTFIYGFLYGAGAEKIGSIVGGDASVGKKLIAKFLEGLPALKALRKAVDDKTSPFVKHPEKGYYIKRDGVRVPNPKYKGFLVGLDGRHLPIRHAHAALNTLLQSAGALIAKKATVILYEDLTTRGFIFGKDWALMGHIHDEVQMWAKPDLAEEIGKAAVSAFEQAGREFNFRCPITGEFKIGDNWKACH